MVTARDDEIPRRAEQCPRQGLGEMFPLQGELDVKLAQLAEVEADLASTKGVGTGDRSTIASV
jgi:hypothetical protein